MRRQRRQRLGNPAGAHLRPARAGPTSVRVRGRTLSLEFSLLGPCAQRPNRPIRRAHRSQWIVSHLAKDSPSPLVTARPLASGLSRVPRPSRLDHGVNPRLCAASKRCSWAQVAMWWPNSPGPTGGAAPATPGARKPGEMTAMSKFVMVSPYFGGALRSALVDDTGAGFAVTPPVVGYPTRRRTPTLARRVWSPSG